MSIDKTAPTVSSYGPLTKNVLAPLILTAPASDNPSSSGTAVSGVTGGEYYVGTTDPGIGNGVPMTYSGGTLSAPIGDNTLTNLSAGTYQLNVRAKDAAGNWSTPTTARLTVVLPAPTNLYAVTSTNNAPVLTWNSVPTAASYQVWRQDTLTGTNIEVASSVTTTNFTDVYSPGVYNYSVVAVNSAGTTSVPSSAFQVAVTNTTTANARNIKAQGQSQVLPAFGADILPGLASGNTAQSSFDFDIGYPGGAFTITRPLTLTFNAGGHHLFLTSTSADWLVINGANNSQGTFQGLASANLDNVTTTGLPYTVTAVDGALNPAGTSSLKLTVYTDNSRSTVLYSVNDTLTKGKIKIN